MRLIRVNLTKAVAELVRPVRANMEKTDTAAATMALPFPTLAPP